MEPEVREVVCNKIEAVLEHIQNVQRNCYKLGLRMIKNNQVELGRILIANGQIHDNSKFKGIEFRDLFPGSPILGNVVQHHAETNPHHPEYWGGIHNMPDVYLAEMVCDCAARSAEFGTDLRKWMEEVATKKYGFEMHDRVGTTITVFINNLLTPSFKPFEAKT